MIFLVRRTPFLNFFLTRWQVKELEYQYRYQISGPAFDGQNIYQHFYYYYRLILFRKYITKKTSWQRKPHNVLKYSDYVSHIYTITMYTQHILVFLNVLIIRIMITVKFSSAATNQKSLVFVNIIFYSGRMIQKKQRPSNVCTLQYYSFKIPQVLFLSSSSVPTLTFLFLPKCKAILSMMMMHGHRQTIKLVILSREKRKRNGPSRQ